MFRQSSILSSNASEGEPVKQLSTYPTMKGIVDCNNFYCSCERLFKPHLEKKPVVVLSNNDGCIISRSDEAKRLGVQMAAPYFMARSLIEKNNISVFSSNYNLYGDLSWRVMETLRKVVGKDNVEVYSVDEAFVDLSLIPPEDLPALAIEIRTAIEDWTGIKVSVGIAPTKVLAKLANRIAKKNKEGTNCIAILDNDEILMEAMRKTPVGDIWGVGSQYAKKLKDEWGIYDALQLSNVSEEFARTYLGGVVGARLIRELRGVASKDLEEELVNKKMIATTRMFGNPVGDITSIKEAVATYTSRAAEKLRRQHGAAKVISVFVVSKFEQHETNYKDANYGDSLTLPSATSFTNELLKPAMILVDRLFQPGTLYKKAGVVLSSIVPDQSIQGNLFQPESKNCERRLMDMIDNINFSQRDDVLKFAASGTKRNWKMQQNQLSGRYTTRWNELFEVH